MKTKKQQPEKFMRAGMSGLWAAQMELGKAQMDRRRRLCQPAWTPEEIEAIEALSEAKGMPTETVVRQALRSYQLAANPAPNASDLPGTDARSLDTATEYPA